jgi:adenylate cyclase
MRAAWVLMLVILRCAIGLAQESSFPADTARFHGIVKQTEAIYLQDPAAAIALMEEARAISEKVGYDRGLSVAYGWLAYLYEQRGDLKQALELHQSCLALSEALGDRKQMSTSLNNIAAMHTDMGRYAEAFDYHERSLRLKEELGDRNGVAVTRNNLGLLHFKQGKLKEAMARYEQALILFRETGDVEGEASAQVNMAGVRQKESRWDEAIPLLQQALAIYRNNKDSYGMGYALTNLGLVMREKGRMEEAEGHLNEALRIREAIGDKAGQAHTHKQLGLLFTAKNNDEKAATHLNRSIALFREVGDRIYLREVLLMNADRQLATGNLDAAQRDAQSAMDLARELQSPAAIRESAEVLGRIYGKQGKWEESFAMTQLAKTLGNTERRASPKNGPQAMLSQSGMVAEKDPNAEHLSEAFSAHRLFGQMLDSVRNETTRRLTEKSELELGFRMKTLADSLEFVRRSETMALEVARREADIKRQRIMLLSVGLVVVLLLVMAVIVYRGKKRSDGLLLNILPRETAEELKRHGSAKARHFESVTVLFTDFKGFTTLSEQMSPQLLVEEINDCFSAFDRIIEQHGLEKIKTIGDSYMAAGGLPVPNATHAEDVVRAALDIRDHMERSTREKRAKGMPFFEVRIGIHTGPVVAGIVGIKKFQYDIWGDTVNTASRMESAGEAGKVNISESTYQLVKDRFQCHFRGQMEAKGKGPVRMYFVDGPQTVDHPKFI